MDGTTSQEPELPLARWWAEEQAFLDALAGLDEALASGQVGPINNATKKLCVVPKGKPVFGSRFWEQNVFALAMDALLAKLPDSGRQTALVMKIKPPDSAETIIRILTTDDD
jgi:hypothetical protein